MTLHHRNRAGRAGFTLIELLVVIAIIAILVGLTSVAVFQIFVRGDETKARSDVSQLAAAISGCRQEFDVTYVPSRIVLYETTPWPQNNQLDIDSREYIKKMFPGINLDVSGQFFDWNGNGVQDGPHTLEGQYCLVFFLGGIPHPTDNGVTKFNTNNRNPTQAGGERRGSSFTFKSKQLVRGYNGFFYYTDPWGSAYAFFSAFKGKPNAYNRYGSSDCPGLGLSPYYKPSGEFYSSDKFQIICAGKDRNFGAGGAWAPGSTAVGPVADNLCNFYEGLMGSQK